jgi:hypothetical protein
VRNFVDTEEEKGPDRKFPGLNIRSMSGKIGKSRGLRKRHGQREVLIVWTSG